jgi:hypothetical protein
MIIYNVTIKPNWSIHDEWLKWMKEEHIPEMLATQQFYDFKILRLLEVDDTEGPTYAIQYNAHTLESYEHYIARFAPVQRQKGKDKWGDQFIAFRSVMQIVN